MPKVLRNVGFSSDSNNKNDRVMIPDDSEFVPFSHQAVEGEALLQEVVETPQEQAEREAFELLEQAKHDAQQIIENATAQATDIKKTAELSGYDNAFSSQLDAISATLTNATSTLLKIQRAQDLFIDEYQNEIGRFAIEVARAILKHEIEVDPLALCDMAEQAVAEVKEAKWAVLNLSRELVPLVELLQSELPEKCPSIGKLDVVGRPIDKGSCIVDTPNGLIDASIEEQLRNLALRFEQIKQKRGAM